MERVMTTLYGIPNCDTVKKARKWLEAEGVDYTFHDLRADGLTQAQVSGWIDELGWEKVVNRRSTTWREMPEQQRQSMDASSAVAAILEAPTLLKRPLIDLEDTRQVGFNAKRYAELFGR